MRPLLLSFVLIAMACDKPAAPEPSAGPSAPSAATSQNPHPPIAPGSSAPTSPQNASALGPVAQAGGLAFTHTAPLVRRAPKSSMRAAEYGIENDPTSELAVFYFGPGQGGDVESNISRWLGQFSQPDGSDSSQKAKRSEKTIGNIKVSMVEVTGTYGGGMAPPGAPPSGPQADAMLLAAIAVSPSGPVFFKLVGSKGAVEAARPAFDALISSLHPASP